MRRAFIIVLDSFGIGRAKDATAFGDNGSHTLAAIASHTSFFAPQLASLGLFAIPGVTDDLSWEKNAPAWLQATPKLRSEAMYGRMQPASNGKDTQIGHWEIAGYVSPHPMPVYPHGFPDDIIQEFERATGKKALVNRPYSGTKVMEDYGREQLATGDLIVYTSADSVFQIAAHRRVVPVEQLYAYCETARGILTGQHAVGRVIARPFDGEPDNFWRTPERRDFAVLPPQKTLLDVLSEQQYDVIGVGKIHDIFAGQGLTESYSTKSNREGVVRTKELIQTTFSGLCFVNLVDFDMLYGHRNDIEGYARAVTEFDGMLEGLIELLGPEDLLLLTADHGCDPATVSTDHSRESVPLLAWHSDMRGPIQLDERSTFADIAATLADYFDVPQNARQVLAGRSFLPAHLKQTKGQEP